MSIEKTASAGGRPKEPSSKILFRLHRANIGCSAQTKEHAMHADVRNRCTKSESRKSERKKKADHRNRKLIKVANKAHILALVPQTHIMANDVHDAHTYTVIYSVLSRLFFVFDFLLSVFFFSLPFFVSFCVCLSLTVSS